MPVEGCRQQAGRTSGWERSVEWCHCPSSGFGFAGFSSTPPCTPLLLCALGPRPELSAARDMTCSGTAATGAPPKMTGPQDGAVVADGSGRVSL
eukprot:CAMPEP_0177791864 /NCGR_PEP_ID=MMETSP0491_2-20121128/24181_1 /TAXON_ID=63592 /ORGANISM="Tetraselmis chuii, Strain PLY429" /LENGTH=93 /DNA_ID=CAMNT_0019314165 /DNA_START=195 /DNA_END=477 /DNA_ORIENTATION=-